MTRHTGARKGAGMAYKNQTVRQFVYAELHPGAKTEGNLTLTSKVLLLFILVSSALAIAVTEHSFTAAAPDVLHTVEMWIGVVFALEYVVRIWTCVEDSRYAGPWGRLRYAFSFWAIIDLLAVAPLLFLPTAGESVLLRLLRLLRILRLARLGNFSRALQLLTDIVQSRGYELALSFVLSSALMLFAATLLYFAESAAQPDAFGSIPRAIWWAISTLTTVGYGDVYPITVWGKVFAGITAILGIGFVAMPTGILAAAFSDAISHRRNT